MMDCTEVPKLLSAYLDNELDNDTFSQVHGHFQGCQACNKELNIIKRIKDLTPVAFNKIIPIPVELETNILSFIQSGITKRVTILKYLATAVAAVFLVSLIMLTQIPLKAQTPDLIKELTLSHEKLLTFDLDFCKCCPVEDCVIKGHQLQSIGFYECRLKSATDSIPCLVYSKDGEPVSVFFIGEQLTNLPKRNKKIINNRECFVFTYKSNNIVVVCKEPSKGIIVVSKLDSQNLIDLVVY